MLIVVGQVGRAHGVTGEVAVQIRTDDPDRRFAPGTRLATQPAEVGPLTVVSTRPHAGRLLVRFAGVDDRTAAARLGGALLVLDSSQIESPDDPDEFNDYELMGLAVETVSGEAVGEVVDVLHPPGPDLLVVRAGDGPEHLVPFVQALVPTVDLAAGRVVIDPPAGLLDIAEAE